MVGFSMPPHPLTYFEIQKYYQNEPNGFYSRNNLSKIKDEAYVVNLDEYNSIVTHYVALYVNGDNVTYFDSFGVEHIQKETEKFIGSKNISTNIHGIQENDSAMCGNFLIGFIGFMLKGKGLLDSTNLFSSNEYVRE